MWCRSSHWAQFLFFPTLSSALRIIYFLSLYLSLHSLRDGSSWANKCLLISDNFSLLSAVTMAYSQVLERTPAQLIVCTWVIRYMTEALFSPVSAFTIFYAVRRLVLSFFETKSHVFQVHSLHSWGWPWTSDSLAFSSQVPVCRRVPPSTTE